MFRTKRVIETPPGAIGLMSIFFRDLAIFREKSGNVIPTEENTKAAKQWNLRHSKFSSLIFLIYMSVKFYFVYNEKFKTTKLKIFDISDFFKLES